jgi:vancomycin aglycone glucosyltransferase
MYDQHYWSRRVCELGIGTAHGPGGATAESLRAALERTLTRTVTTTALAFAKLSRPDGADIAARALMDLEGAS